MRAIDLDDETAASADEVADVACDRNLAPKRDPELAVRERGPEQQLGWRRARAHFGGASHEQVAIVGVRTRAEGYWIEMFEERAAP